MDELKERTITIHDQTLTIYEEKPHNERLNDDIPVDVNLFDPSYTVAGATGFTVWEGSWVFLNLLKTTSLGKEIISKRIVELGSGTGITGLSMAALGSHVLMTDLPAVTNSILTINFNKNSVPLAVDNAIYWKHSKLVGNKEGSAAILALDWSQPIQNQIKDQDILLCDYVVAVDTVWLTDLLEPFVRTMSSILESPRNPIGILSFKDRYSGTDTFTPVENVRRQFENRGFDIEKYGEFNEESEDRLQKHIYLVRKRENKI